MHLTISEIFLSIQGESSFAGLPCAFVRLAGCNLRCGYCDTRYALQGGTDMTFEAVFARLKALGCGLVEVTGGEPLAQQAVIPFLKALVKKGYRVLLETNGSLPVEQVPRNVVRIMDVKCPSSKMHRRNRLANLRLLGKQDEVKFVLSGERDYAYAKRIIRRYRLEERCSVLLSPVSGSRGLAAKTASWILRDKLNARLNLQLHRILWPKSKQGK